MREAEGESVNSSLDTISILVVDDERDIREGSERILSRIGFNLWTASRGDEGLEIIDREDIAIVLLDLKMPGIDGFEVLEKIREQDRSILVIVITGFATVETAIEAMKLGAYDFIPKPFEPDQLRITVNRAAEKISLEREAKRLEEDKRRTMMDLDTEKSRIHTILSSLPNGVIVTNSNGQVVLVNPAFRQLLNLSREVETGRGIEAYIPDHGLCDLILEISKGRHIDFDDIADYEFSIADEKYLLAKGQPVLGEKNECLGAVVNVMDITGMRMLDQLKNEFVAKVSHELRSPLSTIHEQLALVLRDLMGEMPENDQYILTRAQEKTRGLISVIGDLLDLSRIEEGLICKDPKPVEIDQLLINIVEFLKTRADKKKQSLVLNLPGEKLQTLTADPLALESVFGNLIANAINYTQESGEITVSLDLAGINMRVRVADNGFGIEAKYLEKIFERFYRVKNDRTRYITGTGLGLPIVKGLVDSMGGLIEVDSMPGEGTTFTVLIPVVPH